MFSNSELFFQIYNLSGQNFLLDRLMIFVANELIFMSFLIVFLSIIFGGTKERKAFLFIIISIIFAEIFIKITHIFFLEPRPYSTFNLIPLIKGAPSISFPSEHTTIMATLAFAYFINKSKLTLFFLLSLFWVGFSRIYVGVHYPLDILSGIFYGAFANYLTFLINAKIKLF